MKDYVITIGRQFASGGTDIAKELANRLGIEFYDAELLCERAKEIGIEEGIFNAFDERPSQSFLFSMVMNPYAIDNSINEAKLIEAQRKVICDAANKSSCVIVGRRADKILEDYDNLVSIFISADIDDRVKKYLENPTENVRNPRRYVERKDKERSSYYNYFGDGTWGKADNYTMCFSTSKMSKDDIVDIIVKYINDKFAD
jgi:cytidylate kinase